MKLTTCCIVFFFAAVSSVAAQDPYRDELQRMLYELYQRAAHSADSNYQICRLTTDELKSTAEATATTVLQGVCSPQEMETRFHSLESRLTAQITTLQSSVVNLRDLVIKQEEQLNRQHRRLISSMMSYLKPAPAPPVDNSGVLTTIVKETLHRHGGRKSSVGPMVETTYLDGNSIHSEEELDDGDSEEEMFSQLRTLDPRDDEIQRWNSTIHMEGNNRVFTFYWRIRDMETKMFAWATRRSVRSGNFYVFPGGYRMYLRAYPRQSGDTVYLHVGLTPGEFDDQLPWPFKLKHKLSVLDRTEASSADLSSRVWDPTVLCSAWNWRRPVVKDNYECVGLGFPQELLRSRPGYLVGGDLLVKLTVYLHNNEKSP